MKRALFLIPFFMLLPILAVGAPVYLDDFEEDATVHFGWPTNASDGSAVDRTTTGTITVFKDNASSGTTKGVTDTFPFNSFTGINVCTIDTSVDAFYTSGSNYMAILSGATIDSQSVATVLAHFSIVNRSGDVKTVNGAAISVGATPPTAVQIRTEMDDNSDDFNTLLATMTLVLADTDEMVVDDIPSLISTAEGKIDTIDSIVDNILVDTSVTLDGLIDAIKAVTDLLPDAGALSSIAQAATALSSTTWTDIKAGFVDEALSGLATPADVASALGTYDGPTHAELTARSLDTDDYATSASAGSTPAEIWAYTTKTLQTPSDYKANVADLATTAQMNARTLVAEDYATSASSGTTPAAVWAYTTKTLQTPDDYKANVAALATTSQMNARTIETDDYATSAAAAVGAVEITPAGDIGSVNPNTTVTLLFSTAGSLGQSLDPSADGTVRIYKDDSATQRSSASGIDYTAPFDSIAGQHQIVIDLSDNTDASFYAIGSRYHVWINGMTLGSQTKHEYIGSFNIVTKTVGSIGP